MATTDFVASAVGPVATDTAVNNQDIRTLALILSAQAGFPIELTAGGVDAFDNQADVDLTKSAGQTYDATNKRYAQAPAGYTTVSTSAQAIADGNQSGYPAGNAFDGSTSTVWYSGYTGTSANGNAYIGQDFGSGPQVITQVVHKIGSLQSGNVETSLLIQYSDNKTSWTTAATATISISADTAIAIPAGSAHRYWRALANSNSVGGSNFWGVCELLFQVTAPLVPMVLQSAAFASSIASPSQARVVVQVDPASVAFTVNTDLKVSVSRDGGTTWTQGTLALAQSFGDGTALYDTGLIAIGGQPAGSSLVWRVTTPTGKSVVVSGVALQWKA